jgi:hypothetical protein
MLELSLSPLGNSDRVQRNQWEQPGDVSSISEKGKNAAITTKAKFFFHSRNLSQHLVSSACCHQKSVLFTKAQ